MRAPAAIALLFLLVPPAAAAEAPDATDATEGPDSLKVALQALNERLVDAYEREDVPLLRTLLSERHIHNNVFGSRMDKEAFLRDIEDGTLEFLSYETPEIEWFIGDELAVATGVIRAEAKRGGKPVPATTFRFTRIFAREGGEWKVLLFQNTMIPEAKDSP